MGEKPDFVPPHKRPAWISSEAALEAVRELALAGADKAFCWDMTQAIYGLVRNAQEDRIIEGHGMAPPTTTDIHSVGGNDD